MELLINSSPSRAPWLKLTSGDDVIVTHRMFIRYMEAVHIYVTELICRAAEMDGVDMSESRSKLNKRKHGKVLANKSFKRTSTLNVPTA